MAETEQPYLRIYCVCGQKMKVTGSLFGRPGKCVACRQKIRIPRFEEIPPGTHDIHLKDHPEFLRGKSGIQRKQPSDPVKQRDVVLRRREETDADDPHTPDEDDHVELGDESHVVSTVALDVLEPLRNLFSVGNKLQHQLSGLNPKDTIHAEVKGRLARVKRVRMELEEQLRQMLMEVAIELAMTHDKIAQTQLSARIGEITYDAFKREIYKQRSRRDSLERRQQNLRGWIATTDVQTAGGFVDVPPDSIPDDGFSVTIPSEPKSNAPLVDLHTSGLREAFEQRAVAERKLSELDRIQDRDARTDWKQARANAKSTRLFADANIEFRRDRLKQLRADFSEDLETNAAQLDMVRSRMQSGQLDRAEYDKEEKSLLRGQADLKKALSIIDRALGANSASDVPQAKGTFLGRMAADEQGDAELNPTENWLAWGAAAVLAFAAFLPSIGNLSLVGAMLEFSGAGSYTVLLPLLFAAGIVGATFVRDAQVRVVALSIGWAAGIFIAVWIMREAVYSIGPTSARFRTGPPPFLRPGMIALALSALGTLGSIGFGMRRVGWWPAGLGVLLIVTAMLAAIATTDMGGAYRPSPTVAVVTRPIADGQGQLAQITVRNDGGRALYLMTSASDARSAYQLFVERRTGENSWAEVPASAFASTTPQNVEEVVSGAEATKSASLSAGDYRVLLVSKSTNYRDETPFNIAGEIEAPEPAVEESPEPVETSAAPAEVVVEPVAAVPEPAAEPEPPAEEPMPIPAEPARLQLEFQGAGARGEDQYRFSFIAHLPDGTTNRVFVSLGEEIIDGWSVMTYDAIDRRVTLARGAERMIMAPGERTPLAE